MENYLGTDTSYSQEYKQGLFVLWYNSGKPSSGKLLLNMKPDEDGKIPSRATLNVWIRSWKEQAIELDNQVKEAVGKELIASKVEMFKHHAKLGKEMQRIGLEWIMEHYNELTPNTAVRLLVDGIEIERATAGIPEALEKIIHMNDEDLLEEIRDELTSGPIEIEDADN